MKQMFATVVVVFAIAGCATGQGVATGAADLGDSAPTPTTRPPGRPRRHRNRQSPSPVLFSNGPLPAGSYTIQPFVGSGGLCVEESLQAGCKEAGAEDDSIRITFTVPDGWAGLEGTPSFNPSRATLPPGGWVCYFARGGWLFTHPCVKVDFVGRTSRSARPSMGSLTRSSIIHCST